MAIASFLLLALLLSYGDAFLIAGGSIRSIQPPAASSSDSGLDVGLFSDSTIDWLQKMATSYLIERGEPLIYVLTREGSCVGDDTSDDDDDDERLRLARTCARTNLAIASHDFLRADEAIYCYGNRSFLNGFGYNWAEFVELPSRKCVASGE